MILTKSCPETASFKVLKGEQKPMVKDIQHTIHPLIVCTMVLKRAPSGQILVPRRTPRARLNEAIRIIESDRDFSATREEFDLNDLPDSPELPAMIPDRPIPLTELLEASRLEHDLSAFRRIVEGSHFDVPRSMHNFSPGWTWVQEDSLDCRMPDTYPYSKPKYDGPSPSPRSVSTVRYRPAAQPWQRTIALFILFIWMTYLYSQGDGYYASISNFRLLYAIVGAGLVSEVTIGTSEYPHRRGSITGTGHAIWVVSRRSIIVLCYLAVGMFFYVRNAVEQ